MFYLLKIAHSERVLTTNHSFWYDPQPIEKYVLFCSPQSILLVSSNVTLLPSYFLPYLCTAAGEVLTPKCIQVWPELWPTVQLWVQYSRISGLINFVWVLWPNESATCFCFCVYCGYWGHDWAAMSTVQASRICEVWFLNWWRLDALFRRFPTGIVKHWAAGEQPSRSKTAGWQ